MKIAETRSIICTGHTEMVTFDKFPDSLIVISTGDLNFCDNGVTVSNTADQEMNKEYGEGL